ncbi:hypothetical protein [Streptomyces sp. x-80]|uniref:hypothetical protein n=1 Tax=Streptomyces sp. x-80 TaxID=2789282 RepID=UPI0039807FE1
MAGLLFATGTYRDGFHCSPVIARHLADHVLTPGPPDRRLAWFTPERAPVETMTVAQSITETAAHAAETAHEHGLVLPVFLDDAPVTAYVEQQAGRLYEQLAHPVAPPPEILFLAFVLAARDTGHPHPARQLADYGLGNIGTAVGAEIDHGRSAHRLEAPLGFTERSPGGCRGWLRSARAGGVSD